MNDLRAWLNRFFHAPRQLLRYAPAALVAGTSGAIIGVLVADPALAQTGVGLVLGGLSINLASGLVQPILDAVDDEDRVDAIERGLASGDRDVATLVAGSLTQAGPQLALALPEGQRSALITALEHGMQHSGGAVQIHRAAVRRRAPRPAD